MSTNQNQVIDNPDDIEAHSVYADALTEKGDPRGEFILVQLRLEEE
ncbi:MAG: TIGR02996 domain-containing protein, partial [Proteobacteria bacterium]|nr:TIGR02996 domain-containing protein [Pseudomonadota bacterium]